MCEREKGGKKRVRVFIGDNMVNSTQHGAKDQEYENVLVVFDDIETV